MYTSALLFLPLLSSQAPAGAPPRYRLIELSTTGALFGQAFDVNERRVVVGNIDPGDTAPLGTHAALWTADGTRIALTPDANYHFGTAWSINNAGVVVGDGLLLLRGERLGSGLGQQVRHPTFGEGVVLQCEGGGGNARVQVNFTDVGAKWLIAQYARLETL